MKSKSEYSSRPFKEIPCPHDSGVVKNPKETVPNYHRLLRDEVAELLKSAPSADSYVRAGIQVRLEQGIPGMTCPCPADGPIAQKSSDLNAIFVAEYEKGDDSELVDRIYNLMQA